MRAFFVPAARLGRGVDLRKLTSKLLPSMVILGLIPAVSPLGMCLHIPFVNQIAKAFDLSLFTAQATVTLYMLAFAVSIFLTALVADLISKRIILLAALFVFSAASLLASIAWSFEVLLVARVLQAIGAGFGVVMPYAIIQENPEKSQIGRGISTVSVFHSIAGSLAPLVGGIFTWFVDFRLAFAFVAIYTAYLFVCVCHSEIGIRLSDHPHLPVSRLLEKAAGLLGQRNFLFSMILISSSSALYYGFLSIAPALFVSNIGSSDFFCGLGVFLIAAFWAFGNRLSYRWVIDFGYIKALFLSIIVMSLGMLPLLFYSGQSDPGLTFILMLPYAIGGGIINPIIISRVTHFDPEVPGMASSLIFASQILVGAFSAWFFGFFDLRGLQDIVFFGLCTTLICLVALKALARTSRYSTSVETIRID